MTILQGSQLGIISVQSNTTNLQASQLGLISVSSPPVAAAMDVSQLGVVVVIANNVQICTLDKVFGLGCWTPCANLAYNGE